MKIKKHIVDLFSKFKSKQNQHTPKDIEMQAPPKKENRSIEPILINNFDKSVNELIERLSVVHVNIEFQNTKRKEAFEELSKLEEKAKASIPALIKKRFSNIIWERDFAKDTLCKINTEWYKESICLEEMDFLLKRLMKDAPDCVLANEILSLMGVPAQNILIKKLTNGPDEDKQLCCIKFLKNQKNTSVEFIEILDKIISHSENNSLLVVSIDALSNSDEVSKESQIKTSNLLNSTISDVRLAAIKALTKFFISKENLVSVSDEIVGNLFNCLTDENDAVKNSAIDLLSKINNEFAENFYVDVLKRKGEWQEEDMPAVVNEISPLVKRGEVGHMLITREEYDNNNFWRNYKFKKILDEPNILLGSVLRILLSKQHLNKETINPLLIEILNHFKHEENSHDIVENSIRILEKNAAG